MNPSENSSDRPQVAIAILRYGSRFLLQLRDDIPGIFYPGQWALFGGHVEPGESTDDAMRRELLEEISYAPPVLKIFGCYADDRAIRHVYQGELEVDMDKLILKEGWDLDLWTPEEIRRGDRYSLRAQQVRPLGNLHQRILLDFLDT
ncbi:NUDIX domain-containing protein [Kovacikia minuta CCNUW1]|uniref:NUDIX hydrolase n=1 Tax=Kovacikia minuta TaxID=2931930 RepID=UPI001CCF91B7|nr:NUDIX domain-containing protein [Kovacikia minuta]UBF26509.1 NUDIX domain-containing protein [Kovacikia minuta CCNUW1]